MGNGYKIGNGYEGVVPKFDGRSKLYLEATGIAPGSEAYKNLCDWFAQDWGGLQNKASCAMMQAAMVEEVLPNMMDASDLISHLRQIFSGDKTILAELIIRRYGLDTLSYEGRKMNEVVPELAREFGYAESTVKMMMPKALDALRGDTHFREALVVPELSGDLLNYWKFVIVMLTGFHRKVEQIDWSEEDLVEVAVSLQKIGASNPAVLNQTVENWLSTLPDEVRLATKMMYGLGYPAIGRADDYIMAASGFDMKQRSLQDFLLVKLNRASLCAILGTTIADVNYEQLIDGQWVGWSRTADIGTLGLPLKVAEALREGGILLACYVLALDMYSEEDQPWTKCVPSKYWRDVVQLWFDLRIKYEVDEFRFENGRYAYDKVS